MAKKHENKFQFEPPKSEEHTQDNLMYKNINPDHGHTGKIDMDYNSQSNKTHLYCKDKYYT